MSEMATLSTLCVLILLNHLQNVTPRPSRIKLNLGLTEIRAIRAGMSAVSDDEEVARSNNDTVQDVDEDDFPIQDISLWFDHNGICYSLMEEGHGQQHFASGFAARASSTPAVTATVSGGTAARRRLTATAVLPALVEASDERDTFLSKMIKLVLACHEMKAEGAQMEVKNHLIVDKEKMFEKNFVTHSFINMTSEVCRHLGLNPPDPDHWGDKIKIFKVFVAILDKYQTDTDEDDHIIRLFDGEDRESTDLRTKYHAIIEVLVRAKYLDGDILAPENNEHRMLMRAYWGMNFETVLSLFESAKCRKVVRKRIVDIEKFKEKVALEISPLTADLIVPAAFEKKRNEIVEQGLEINDELKKAIDNLVFGWNGFFITEGKADASKMMVVLDYGLVTVVYPAKEEDLDLDNTEPRIHIVEDVSETELLAEKFGKDIEEALRMVEEKEEELRRAWDLQRPDEGGRHVAGLTAAVASGQSRRVVTVIATQPRARRESVHQIPRAGQGGGNVFLKDFDFLDMHLSSFVTTSGQTRYSPGRQNEEQEEEVPVRTQGARDWGLGASQGSKLSRTTLMSRIDETNKLYRGIPQMSSISERLSLEQLNMLEADVTTVSESVKNIAQLQRELDKQGDAAPVVTLYTDGGSELVSSAQWVNGLIRETTLLSARVRAIYKTKQDGESEAQKALLKGALEYKVPELKMPSEFLRWSCFNKEFFSSNPAILEAASSNPGFLMNIKQKLSGQDAQDTAMFTSAKDLFGFLDTRYLATGYAVHMAFKHILGTIPKVMDMSSAGSAAVSRQNTQMLKNISVFLEQMTYIVKLDQWTHVQDEHVSLVEDKLFTKEYFNIYVNITNKFAVSSTVDKAEILQRTTFGQQDMSILDESGSGLSASTSILDETPIHLRRHQQKELISLEPPENRRLTPVEYCKILVILATTVKGSIGQSKIREQMRTRATGQNHAPKFHGRTSANQDTASKTPINNTTVEDDDFEVDVSVNMTGLVDGKKKKVPKAPCPLGCGHSVPLGSARWCDNFKAMQIPERKKTTKKIPLCSACLLKGHPPGQTCKAKITCYHCKSSEHNSYLHDPEEDGPLHVNNTEADETEDGDLSCFMTNELEAELEEVLDINLTHLGNLNSMENGNDLVNAVKFDPTALETLKRLIENAKPQEVSLDLDTWDHDKKEEMRDVFEKLKRSVLESKSRHRAGLEDADHDINVTELTKIFQAGAEKVSKPLNQEAKQKSSYIYFDRDGTINSVPRPVPGEQLSPSLLQEIMRSNSDFITASQCVHEIKNIYTKVSAKSFYKISEIQGCLNEICKTKQLSFVYVDVLIDHMTESVVEKLSEMVDVRVRYHNGTWLCTCLSLLDEGSSTNLTLSPLVNVLNLHRLHRIRANITTVNGTSTLVDYKYRLDIRTDGHSNHSLSTVKIENISGYKGLSPNEVACLEHVFGLDNVSSKYFIISGVPIKAYLLIGCEEGTLHSVKVLDPRSIGLQYNVFSPRLMVSYVPFASGQKFTFSGSFGISPKLISFGSQTPHILMPAEVNNDQHITEQVNKFISLLQSPHHLTSNSCLYKEIFETPLMVSTLPTQDTSINNTDILCDTDSELLNEVADINFTQTDARTLCLYMEGEKCLITPFLLCPGHEKLRLSEVSSCRDCAVRNQNDTKSKELARYSDLWDRVYRINWKDGHRIMMDMPFDRAGDQIGLKHHSNIVPALKASTSLLRKCEKEGSLHVIDGQFRARIANGQLSPLTPEEIQGIMSGKIQSQFILRNKVANLKSESSPSRLVANTAHKIDFTDSSLVDSDPCAKHNLVDLLGLSLKVFTSSNTVMTDIKGAYLAIGLSDATKYFYLNVWFVEPEKYGAKYPIILKSENLDFGFGSASLILRIGILKYAVPDCEMEVSKDTVSDSTYVDNIGFVTIPDVGQLALSLIDVKTAMDKNNLVIDKFYIPQKIYDHPDMKIFKEKYNVSFKPSTVTLGVSWCLIDDTVIPATNLTLFPTHRGIPTGESMRKTDLNKTLMTRRTISRTVAQIWDNCGRFYAPAQAGAKWLLTKTCKVLSLSEMDVPIINRDKDLGLAVAAFWTNMSQTDINPFPRCTVRSDWRIIAIVQDHDASIALCGTAMYIISEGPSGERESHVLSAKSLLSWSTVIGNETRGHALASHLLLSVLSAISPVLRAYDFHPAIIVIGDNLPSCYLYREDSKQTLTRNVRHSVLANLVTIHQTLPGTEIVHCWLPSKFLSSDLLTKFFPDPADLINGDKWRHGDSQFLQPQTLTHFWYLRSTSESTRYRELPTNLEQNTKMSFQELVENNNLKDEDLYQVEFDKNNYKVSEKIPMKKDDQVTCDLLLNEAVTNTEGVNIDCFLAGVELEERAGYHTDIYNRSFVVKYTEAMVTGMSDERVNMVETRNMKKKKKEKTVYRCSMSDFVHGADTVKHENILDTDTEGPDLNPMSKELYFKLSERSFDVVKILNMVVVLMRWRYKALSKDEVITRAWRALVMADQRWSPPDTSSVRPAVFTNHGVLMLGLRCHGMSLPLLDKDGPLMTRIVNTVHHQHTNVDKFPDQHFPMAAMRNTILRSRFGVYCQSLDKCLHQMMSKCSGCLRTILRQFKAPKGERYALMNPDSDLFSDLSADPLGPIVVKNHVKSRRSSVQCYVLVLVCHNTKCALLQMIADLTHQSIILGLKVAERRYSLTFKRLWFDAGSSLSAALLESDLRGWTVYQHPAMGHERVYSENRISVIKPLWNKLFKKYSREQKTCCPINIFELEFITSQIQAQINQVPYSRYSSFCPSTLLHGKGLEVEGMFRDLEEAEAGLEPLDRLTTWLKTMRKFRNEILGQVAADRSSVARNEKDIFTPMEGDVCVALTGDNSKCDLVTVCDDGDGTEHGDDEGAAGQTVQRKDHKDKYSERTVLVKSGRGKPKPYPVSSLRLMTEGEKRRDLRLKGKEIENPF